MLFHKLKLVGAAAATACLLAACGGGGGGGGDAPPPSLVPSRTVLINEPIANNQHALFAVDTVNGVRIQLDSGALKPYSAKVVGKQAVYIRADKFDQGVVTDTDIFIVDLDTGTKREVNHFSSSVDEFAGVSGEQVLLKSRHSGGVNLIHVFRASSEDPSTLNVGPGHSASVENVSMGAVVGDKVFTLQQKANGAFGKILWMNSVEGGQLTKIFDEDGFDAGFEDFIDGRIIYSARNADGQKKLESRNITGGDEKPIAAAGQGTQPIISNSYLGRLGNRLVYKSDFLLGAGVDTIKTVDPVGNNTATLLQGADANGDVFIVGSSLVFKRTDQNGTQLFSKREVGEAVQLTSVAPNPPTVDFVFPVAPGVPAGLSYFAFEGLFALIEKPAGIESTLLFDGSFPSVVKGVVGENIVAERLPLAGALFSVRVGKVGGAFREVLSGTTPTNVQFMGSIGTRAIVRKLASTPGQAPSFIAVNASGAEDQALTLTSVQGATLLLN